MGADFESDPGAMKRAGQILSGIFGGLLIFVGAPVCLGGLTNSPFRVIVGACLVCAGSILIPPISARLRRCWAWLRPEVGPPLVAMSLLIGGLVVGGIAAMALPDQGDTKAGGSSANSDVKVQVTAAWSELTRITQPCDTAAGVFSKTLESRAAGSVTAYRVASQAKSICANAGLDVLAVPVPKGLSSPHSKAFRDALAGCGAAYAGRSVMYGEMMKVLDGDRRSSQLARVQMAAEASQNEVVQCGLNVISVANQAGVELPSSDVPKAD